MTNESEELVAGANPVNSEDVVNDGPETPAPGSDRDRGRRRRDPLVSLLGITILLIVILTLVTVIYALLTGVFGTGAPRTMSEQKIVMAAAAIEAGSTDPLDWMAYILALTDDGQYLKAQEWIDRGAEVLPDQDISADMKYMQADLYYAQGDLDRALEMTEEALGIIRGRYDADTAEFEESGGRMSKAIAFGISDNYWELLLLKAEIHEDREEWGLALEVYDEYLEDNVTAANVFTLRGAVKEQLGDAPGAEADFRRTLEFIPNDPDALAGLERIGATQ